MSPLKSLRVVGSVYVEVARNTPLTLVFVFFVFVLPATGFILPLGRVPAIIALTTYTSAFVCEAVRSGINSVGGTVVGDVDSETVRDVAGYLTPVPGGLGPLTNLMLIRHTLIGPS